jgi:hypothetical protein
MRSNQRRHTPQSLNFMDTIYYIRFRKNHKGNAASFQAIAAFWERG